MTDTDNNSDLLTFADDLIPEGSPQSFGKPWKILVVDDDEQVHATTRIVLRHMHLLGRPIEIFEAHSAAEAKTVIPGITDLAVILLDVVMESDDAGLTLVSHIRKTLELDEVRIILRTGQPGYAPELEIIEQYDINDYKTKQELTHNRLITTLTAAVRGYEQIRTINQNRKGLHKIIHAATKLFGTSGMLHFSEEIFTQTESLLSNKTEGLLCVHHGDDDPMGPDNFHIIGTTNNFISLIDLSLRDLPAPAITRLITECLNQGEHQYQENRLALHLRGAKKIAIMYLELTQVPSQLDRQLLEVFATTIAMGYENLTLVQRLEFTAYFDLLTGLPNRQQYLKILDEDTRHRRESMISCLLDIDHFADINDGLGQEVGNQILMAVANRLKSQLSNCVVARVGPDVFGLYGPDSIISPGVILPIFQESFRAGEYTLPITVTLGFCRALENGEPGAWQMKFANIALNRAKKNLRDRYEYFKDEMEEQMRWRLEVINKLRRTFQNELLELWFQPQVNAQTGRPIGIEALLRWRDEKNGFISPSVFVPLAEYSGLIIDIGYWVIEEATKTLSILDAQGHTGLSIAINVSVPQFRSSGFVDRIEGLVAMQKVDPSRVEIEITESIVMDEPKVVIQGLERLRQDGFKVAIDDFGTGFSSMSYLTELPLDTLKIDKSFVDKLDSDAGQAIVRTIINLCATLGLHTIAEGVESKAQADILKTMGCNYIQGYYYGKPMALPDLLTWLSKEGL